MNFAPSMIVDMTTIVASCVAIFELCKVPRNLRELNLSSAGSTVAGGYAKSMCACNKARQQTMPKTLGSAT